MKFRLMRDMGIPIPRRVQRPEVDRRTPWYGYTRPQAKAIEAARAELARQRIVITPVDQLVERAARRRYQKPTPIRVTGSLPSTGKWWAESGCYWCGKPFAADPFSPLRRTREHLIPKAFGGSGATTNTASSHARCNNLRGVNLLWQRYVPWAGSRATDPERALRGQRRRIKGCTL